MDSRRSSASHKHWKLNWWDLWPLVDGERRPLQWASDSLILSPHPSSPAVMGRIFPSGISVILPAPNPILNNPASYAPPSVIAASANNQFVFAFFPGHGHNCVGCIWQRNSALDSWTIESTWTPLFGQDIVAAHWIDSRRQWIPGDSPMRPPAVGPAHSFAQPILLLISRNYMVHLISRYSRSFGLKMFTASLRHATISASAEHVNPATLLNGSGGLNICTKAAFGLTYHESSIIIAMFSSVIPSAAPDNSDFSEFGGIPTTPLGAVPSSWETFGPEQPIHLCEVQITYHNFQPALSTNPLPPIFPQAPSSSHLTDLLIVPRLPPAISSGENLTSKSRTIVAKAGLELVLTYLDVEDYSSPKSNVLCFEITRNINLADEDGRRPSWVHRHLSTRSYTESIISFIIPSKMTSGATSVMVGLLDFEGFTSRQPESESNAVREVRIGKVIRVTLPDFLESDEWEPSALMTTAEDAGCHPPVSVALSPNELYMCTGPSLWSRTPKLGLHLLPRIKPPSSVFPVTDISQRFIAAMLSDRTTCDLVHFLTNPNVELSTIMEVLESISAFLHDHSPVLRDWNIWLTRLAIEVFMTRSKKMSQKNADSKEKESLDERARAGIEICSLKTLCSAFNVCKEDQGYELEPIWHLIALSTWLVDFCEKLVRNCVMWHSQRRPLQTSPSNDVQAENLVVKKEAVDVQIPSSDDSPSNDPTEIPSLIHLIHPYALDNLIGAVSHVNGFRALLGSLTASRLRSDIAKEILVDAVDGSGINFIVFEAQLKTIRELDEFGSLDEGLRKRCLYSLSPLPATDDLLFKACELLILPSCGSKARIFIKPADLIDGISRLNLTIAKSKQERDVISKVALGVPQNVRACLRCGGKTGLARVLLPRGSELRKDGDFSFNHWLTWEHQWERCVCGGQWVKTIRSHGF